MQFLRKRIRTCTQECPYCHCSIEAEVQVLRPEERDTFDGVTIEQDGNAEGGTRVEDMRTERRTYEQNNGGRRSVFIVLVAEAVFCQLWQRS